MRGETSFAALSFRVICISFSAALLVLTLLTHVQLVRKQSGIEELEKKITRAENERVVLEIQKTSDLNLAELERRALQELGMHHPGAGQIVNIEYLG